MGLACRSHKMHQHPPSMLLNVSETSRIIGEILDSCANRPTKVKTRDGKKSNSGL